MKSCIVAWFRLFARSRDHGARVKSLLRALLSERTQLACGVEQYAKPARKALRWCKSFERSRSIGGGRNAQPAIETTDAATQRAQRLPDMTLNGAPCTIECQRPASHATIDTPTAPAPAPLPRRRARAGALL